MKTPRPKTPPKKPAPRLALDEERLLKIKEVADLDRCSEKTVRRAIDAGLLEAMRVGAGGRLLRVTPRAHAAYRQLIKTGR